MPGTAACADTGIHRLLDRKDHVGTPTHCGLPTGGFEPITGLGNTRLLRARSASCAGVGCISAAGGGVVSHTSRWVVVAIGLFGLPPVLTPSGQVSRYQAPFSPVCAFSPGCGVKVGSVA